MTTEIKEGGVMSGTVVITMAIGMLPTVEMTDLVAMTTDMVVGEMTKVTGTTDVTDLPLNTDPVVTMSFSIDSSLVAAKIGGYKEMRSYCSIELSKTLHPFFV